MPHMHPSRGRRLLVQHLLGTAALLLAACSGPGAAPSADSTPPAPTGGQPYTNQDFGFSLSYPTGFEVQQVSPNTVVFLAPQGTAGHRERGWLTAQFTSEEDAQWYADHTLEDNANLGIEITSSVQVLDGRQAYVLGHVPGQDLNRQVFIVDGGILYHLTFMPDDPAQGEDYQQMESLYAAIMPSLRFLPERRAVPPLTDLTNMIRELELALNARNPEAIARLLGNEFVLGTLDPTTAEGVTYAPHGPTEIIPLILEDHLSANPTVTLLYQVDWSSVPGSLDTYSGIVPGEDLTPILAQRWGTNDSGEAVLLIARRVDSGLFWRGAFVLEGTSTP